MNGAPRLRFEALKSSGMLPSPKGIALAILEITQRPNAGVGDILPLFKTDPAMAGKVLQYANAAQARNHRHIVSLKQAITFLGLFRVRQVALSFSLIDQYRSGKCALFNYSGYWSTSLATGIAAQRLAALACSPPDESFTCGLLSDVGRLALASVFPSEYSKIIGGGVKDRELIQAENNRFGIDHSNLSAEMLIEWGLPDIFANAVRHHECPTLSPFPPGSRAFALTVSLHFATQIGHLLNHDQAQRWNQTPALYNAAAQAGMDKDEIPDLINGVVTDWQAWARELKLPTRDFPELHALLASPPTPVDDSDPATLMILPFGIVLMVNHAERLKKWLHAIQSLELKAETVANWEELGKLMRQHPLDIAILDIEQVSEVELNNLKALRDAAGHGFYCIALIPVEAEKDVARLMLAGASDYLLYSANDAALLARLVNAQKLISLQSLVKAERELAITSSGEWARTSRRLIQDALTDVLTQLPNRRYGLDRFAQEWSISSSSALPIGCLMLDIDHFKQVNDKHGHDIGDMVLRQIAAVIESNCRRSDFVFRYGGEEFCVICPNTTQGDAILLGERIADAIRGEKFGPPGSPFPLTISIGVAIRGPALTEVGELVAQADKALYAAKMGGRNRVVAS